MQACLPDADCVQHGNKCTRESVHARTHARDTRTHATHFVCMANSASAPTVAAVTATASSTTFVAYTELAAPTSTASHAVKANNMIRLMGCLRLRREGGRSQGRQGEYSSQPHLSSPGMRADPSEEKEQVGATGRVCPAARAAAASAAPCSAGSETKCWRTAVAAAAPCGAAMPHLPASQNDSVRMSTSEAPMAVHSVHGFVAMKPRTGSQNNMVAVTAAVSASWAVSRPNTLRMKPCGFVCVRA